MELTLNVVAQAQELNRIEFNFRLAHVAAHRDAGTIVRAVHAYSEFWVYDGGHTPNLRCGGDGIHRCLG